MPTLAPSNPARNSIANRPKRSRAAMRARRARLYATESRPAMAPIEENKVANPAPAHLSEKACRSLPRRLQVEALGMAGAERADERAHALPGGNALRVHPPRDPVDGLYVEPSAPAARDDGSRGRHIDPLAGAEV